MRIFELLTFLWLGMRIYYFMGKKLSLDQYKGSNDHSAYTQYTRKEVFLPF
jgi:hypothetical protein